MAKVSICASFSQNFYVSHFPWNFSVGFHIIWHPFFSEGNALNKSLAMALVFM